MNAVQVFSCILIGVAFTASVAIMLAVPYHEATNELKICVKFLLFIAVLGLVFFTLAK